MRLLNHPGQDGNPASMNTIDTDVLTVETAAGQDREEAGSSSTPIRAVAVDNSPTVLKMLSSLLEKEGNVDLIGTATDGHHGVRRVVELEPDLVLMALRLEGMNGLEATRQIKARPHAPAVIMVTAEDTPECRAAARAAGTDAFVGKQHVFRQLRTAIRELFSRSPAAWATE
jgi:CheY-like chemotaxis protein